MDDSDRVGRSVTIIPWDRDSSKGFLWDLDETSAQYRKKDCYFALCNMLKFKNIFRAKSQ